MAVPCYIRRVFAVKEGNTTAAKAIDLDTLEKRYHVSRHPTIVYIFGVSLKPSVGFDPPIWHILTEHMEVSVNSVGRGMHFC